MSPTRIREFLQEREAHTHPEHPDPGLRGRTYAIPFSRVWNACVGMASGRLNGWQLTHADEDTGLLRADCSSVLRRTTDQVEIRLSLDENAQTRVDVSSASPGRRWSMGRHSRRIRRFFRALDQAVGAGPGKILDPTLPLVQTTLVVLGMFGFACHQPDGEASDPSVQEPDSEVEMRNFQTRSYERNIVFLAFQGDTTLLVPWSFLARTGPDGVHREIRGWLARGDNWDPFLQEAWEGPTTSVPWRVLPHGPVRLVVGMGDALERVVFQDGGRSLEVALGDLLVEWSGQRGQIFRVHEGTLLLADQTVEGDLLDMTRAWARGDTPLGDWGILISGDSVQVVLEDLGGEPDPDGGTYALWARIEFVRRQWREVRFTWSDVRSFEPARRDVPMGWEVASPDGELTGTLTTLSPFLQAGEGEGPLLPLEALFPVSGFLDLDGARFPILGLIHHTQH